MTYEKFVARNKLISDRLDEIALRTANMALAGTAFHSNPDFEEIMRAQDYLLQASEKLLDTYESHQPSGDKLQ